MLAGKLHLKPGMRVAVANAPAGFSLGTLPAGLTQEKALARGLDLVVLFARNQKALKGQWPKAIAALNPDGALWVSYPKKSSGIDTDLSTGEWDATKGSGWNPVSMIAIDDTWSAVRFKHSPGLEGARAVRHVVVHEQARVGRLDYRGEAPRDPCDAPDKDRRDAGEGKEEPFRQVVSSRESADEYALHGFEKPP